jgi:hypothetical protein
MWDPTELQVRPILKKLMSYFSRIMEMRGIGVAILMGVMVVMIY